MQSSENPSNSDIREALGQFQAIVEQQFQVVEQRFQALDDKLEKLDERVEKLDYKFDVYQKGTDGMVRMATTIIIATASVVVLSSLSPAVAALVTALSANQGG